MRESERTVQALIGSYKDGVYTFSEIAWKLVELSEAHDLDDLTSALPHALRSDFVALMKEHYANDLPAESFVSPNSDGHMSPIVLENLRAWLSRQN